MPSSTPAPSELPWPWPTISLGRGVIHKVPFPPDFTDNRIESSGPLAVFTEPVSGDSQTPIWLADLVTGRLSKIYVPPVPVAIEEPVISGQEVAWMESEGVSTWRVNVQHLGDPTPTTIATFHAPTERTGVVRIDGNDLAYVEPGEPGHGDTIHLLTLTPVRTLRTIRLPDSVYKLGLAETTLFSSAGTVTAPPQLSVHDTSAWLASAEDPAPRKVADDAFELGFDGHWMTWVRDPSQGGQGDQVLAMAVGQTVPIILSPEPQPNTPGGLFTSIWPSVGNGIVAWSIDGTQRFALAVWPVRGSTPVGILGMPVGSIAGTSIGAGWLDWNEGQAIGGAKVSDILAAMEAAGIH